MTFVVAKEFEPAIVYIDEVEKVWPAKKKKKKGQKKTGNKKDSGTEKKAAARTKVFKSALTKWRTKFVND